MAHSAWKRLIKYIPVDGSVERYGEPILGETELLYIDELVKGGKLRVRVFEGTEIFDLSDTGREEVVSRLCGIFAPQDVPIIRCIGLNYKSHSM